MTEAAALAAAARVLKRQNDPAFHDIADALADFAAGRIDSIDRALGIGGKPGRSRNTTLGRLQRRDAAVCAATDKYDGLPEQIGRAMHRDLTSYGLSGWLIDRRTGSPPSNRLHLYAIRVECTSNDDVPGPGRLAQIVRAGSQNE